MTDTLHPTIAGLMVGFGAGWICARVVIAILWSKKP